MRPRRMKNDCHSQNGVLYWSHDTDDQKRRSEGVSAFERRGGDHVPQNAAASERAGRAVPVRREGPAVRARGAGLSRVDLYAPRHFGRRLS